MLIVCSSVTSENILLCVQSVTTLWKGIGSTLMVKGVTMASETAIHEITPFPRFFYLLHFHHTWLSFEQYSLILAVQFSKRFICVLALLLQFLQYYAVHISYRWYLITDNYVKWLWWSCMSWMQGSKSTQFTEENCWASYAERVSWTFVNNKVLNYCSVTFQL